MKQRVQDLVRIGDSLFAKRAPIMSLWQTQAENFHVMRADFTRARYFSEEFGSYLMTGRPARCHRDLKNAFSAMLRPRGQQWFHAATDNELVNEDRDAKMWLDWASKVQRRAMYDARGGFVRATKEGDGDFAAFGNAVITRDVVDYEHLLYKCWHLRDVAWDEGYTGAVNNVHFNWKPQARQQVEKFGNGKLGVSPKVAALTNEDRFKEIKCRRVILPANEYDLPAKQTHGKPWVSIYVDIDNEHVLEEVALRTFPVTIPRWEFGGSMFGNQYGFSPAVVYGLPDARMLQQMMLSMLEASEKGTSPPMIAVGEAINGGVNLYAAGITQVDADYDERLGEVMRPVQMQLEGLKYGAEQIQRLEQGLDDAFYLSKIRFPSITKEMTAYEASKLWDDFIRESLPLFEPVEVDYNANLCESSFEDLLGLGAFGSVDDMPQMLRGRDINFQFDTPITVAANKALSGAFTAMMQTLTQGAQVDPSVVHNVDLDVAVRDAIDGDGAPAKWMRSVDQVKKIKGQLQQQAAAQQAADQVAHGADVATRVATAAESAGNASMALQDAGAAAG
jgi:hypothetical protein